MALTCKCMGMPVVLEATHKDDCDYSRILPKPTVTKRAVEAARHRMHETYPWPTSSSEPTDEAKRIYNEASRDYTLAKAEYDQYLNYCKLLVHKIAS